MNPCLYCKFFRFKNSNRQQRCKLGHPLSADCPDFAHQSWWPWKEEQRKSWICPRQISGINRVKNVRALNRGVVFGQ
jgi:hypothetical protein